MPRIVSMGDPHNSTWEYTPTGITYYVPENAHQVEYTHTTGTSYVYSTQEQFQSHFAQKSGVSASYGAFSGQFNMAYSQSVNSDVAHYWAIYEADFSAWQLDVLQTAANWLTPEFTNDPDIQSLPSIFTPATRSSSSTCSASGARISWAMSWSAAAWTTTRPL